jgi:hypothetical protein
MITPPLVIDFDGGAEMQSRTAYAGNQRHDGKKSEPGSQPIGASDHCFYR